jgi:hypothetical protein
VFSGTTGFVIDVSLTQFGYSTQNATGSGIGTLGGSPIPEPGTALLLLGGLAAAGAGRALRRQ